MKNALTSSAKRVLIPLGLAKARSETVAAIQQKIHGSETYDAGTTTLIISNELMEDIIKIVTFIEESGFLITGASETVKKEAIEQKGGFHGILVGTSAASLLGNMPA